MAQMPPSGAPTYASQAPQYHSQQSYAPPPPPLRPESKGTFDVFELLTAVVLGIAALGGAWAGHQSGLWGGNCQTAYGEAANLTSRGGTTYQLGVMKANRDSLLDLQAKQLILEGMTTEDEVTKLKTLGVAKYLYARQMSEEGYEALKLPAEYRTKDDDKLMKMPEKVLEDSLENELEDEFFKKMTAPGQTLFDEADKKFEEGREANQIGDQFGLAVVLFTIALFFGGIALVFKSVVRWGFFGVGFLSLAMAMLFMLSLPSAGTGLGVPVPATSGSAKVLPSARSSG
jgi:hypothetical protein